MYHYKILYSKDADLGFSSTIADQNQNNKSKIKELKSGMLSL